MVYSPKHRDGLVPSKIMIKVDLTNALNLEERVVFTWQCFYPTQYDSG